MKTNMKRYSIPVIRPNQFPAGFKAPPAGASTPRISESAFYLIALAVLLKESLEPARFRQLLIPGTFTGYGKLS